MRKEMYRTYKKLYKVKGICIISFNDQFMKIMPSFHYPEKNILKTLWTKKKMLETSIISFSHNVFHLMREKLHHLSHIEVVVCKCFEFGEV